MTKLRILGPTQLWVAGRQLDLGPVKQRTVLAALLVDAGRAVPVETLIDRVWPDGPPAGVRSGLYSYIAKLRRVLEPAGARLENGSGGYRLDVPLDVVDLQSFRGLLKSARECADDVRRAEILREAVDLWRGEALGQLTGAWVERMRDALEQERLDAVVLWAQTMLRLGQPEPVVSELRELLVRHPLVEPLIAGLTEALYKADRRAEALQCYAQARQRIVDELGAEPGPQLRELYQLILRDDVGRPVAKTTARPVPAQLPSDVAGFTGRVEQLRHLDSLLPDPADPGRPGSATAISVISGGGGVGKTSLAVHWAHRVRELFPDGQLYVNLRGFDPSGTAVEPTDAIRRFLDALQVPLGSIPSDVDARSALYRSVLADRRMLIVLDNSRSAEQVRPLLPGAPGCLVLTTSRNRLAGLVATEGADVLPLDLLPPDEARQMLAGRIDPVRLAAEPDAVEEILAGCARLPLALAVAAARATTEPHRKLAALAADLRDARGRLDALTTEDPLTDMRTVFSWSYRALTPAAARLFRLLGLHCGPDFSAPAAASLSGLHPDQVRIPLTELGRAHLVIEHAPGRYVFHDLLRVYATEQARRNDPDTDRRAAVQRTVDHYLHSAHAADRLLHPSRDLITPPPAQPGAIAESFADREAATAWFTVDHPVLVAAVHQATAAGLGTHTWHLAWNLATFLDRRGHWQDWATVQQAALEAARGLADRRGQALAHRHLGHAYRQLGRHQAAYVHLGAALDLFGELADHTGQAHTQMGMGELSVKQGRHAEAIDHARQALTLFRTTGNRVGQAMAYNAIGWYHTAFDAYPETLTYCGQALALSQEIGDRRTEAASWDSLGYAHHHLGHYAQAIDCYQHTLDICRERKTRYQEAQTLSHLGDAHLAAGTVGPARGCWAAALRIFDDLDYPDTDAVRDRLRDLIAGHREKTPAPDPARKRDVSAGPNP